METKAKSISLTALSSAVAKAVEHEQTTSSLGASFTTNHPIIMGRWFDGQINLADAEGLATRITKQVEQSGVIAASTTSVTKSLEPAFLWHGGHIILGFIMDGAHSLTE